MQEKVIYQRRERLFDWAKQARVSTLWISMPANRNYLSAYKADDGPYGESSGWLIFSNQRAYLLVDNRYTLEAKQEAIGVEVVDAPTLLKAFEKVLPEIDLESIGYEEDYITVGDLRRVSDLLKERGLTPRLVPVDGFLKNLRETKGPEELEIIRKGAEILSLVMEGLVDSIKEGQKETQVANRVRELAFELGAEDLAFPPIVASGPNSSLPHARPSSRVIRSGEPLVVDIGIKYHSYMTDMTRTIFLGGPEGEFKEIYAKVLEAQRLALSFISQGMRAMDLDALVRGFFERNACAQYFSHGLGHGIGLAVHESPRIGPTSHDTLKDGHVFTVEPGLYLPGKGGVRIEDMVVLQDGRMEVLTKGVGLYDL